jgi:hypothetical protein
MIGFGESSRRAHGAGALVMMAAFLVSAAVDRCQYRFGKLRGFFQNGIEQFAVGLVEFQIGLGFFGVQHIEQHEFHIIQRSFIGVHEGSRGLSVNAGKAGSGIHPAFVGERVSTVWITATQTPFQTVAQRLHFILSLLDDAEGVRTKGGIQAQYLGIAGPDIEGRRAAEFKPTFVLDLDFQTDLAEIHCAGAEILNPDLGLPLAVGLLLQFLEDGLRGEIAEGRTAGTGAQ